MAFLDENGVAQLWAAVKDRLAGAFDSVEFDVAKQAANLVSGDSIATAFGKLAKNYTSILTSISDLNTTLGNRITEVNTNLTNQINTKLNKSDVLANYTTTATGKTLDASLGPAIKEKMDLADTLNTKVTNVINRTNGMFMVTYVDIPGKNLTNGYVLTNDMMTRLNQGWHFAFWFPMVVTSGFVSSVPAYVANPAYPAGGFYCNQINTAGTYRFMFMQVKNNI